MSACYDKNEKIFDTRRRFHYPYVQDLSHIIRAVEIYTIGMQRIERNEAVNQQNRLKCQ